MSLFTIHKTPQNYNFGHCRKKTPTKQNFFMIYYVQQLFFRKKNYQVLKLSKNTEKLVMNFFFFFSEMLNFFRKS